MNALLLTVLLLASGKSTDPEKQCECAEWSCPKEGKCVCVKTRRCPVRKPEAKDNVEVEIDDFFHEADQ